MINEDKPFGSTNPRARDLDEAQRLSTRSTSVPPFTTSSFESHPQKPAMLRRFEQQHYGVPETATAPIPEKKTKSEYWQLFSLINQGPRPIKYYTEDGQLHEISNFPIQAFQAAGKNTLTLHVIQPLSEHETRLQGFRYFFKKYEEQGRKYVLISKAENMANVDDSLTKVLEKYSAT